MTEETMHHDAAGPGLAAVDHRMLPDASVRREGCAGSGARLPHRLSRGGAAPVRMASQAPHRTVLRHGAGPQPSIYYVWFLAVAGQVAPKACSSLCGLSAPAGRRPPAADSLLVPSRAARSQPCAAALRAACQCPLATGSAGARRARPYPKPVAYSLMRKLLIKQPLLGQLREGARISDKVRTLPHFACRLSSNNRTVLLAR